MCGKPFNHKKNLDRHKKTVHEGLRDFSCPNCKAAFGAKQTAEKHILKCATNSFLLQRGPKFLSIVSDKEWKIENGGSCLYPIYQTASQIFCNNESTLFFAKLSLFIYSFELIV